MTDQRYVFLDPDGMAGGTGWLYVVVRAETGVVYQQQYGGTACRQGKVEGFLVPVHGPDSLTRLRELFEGHFRGAGTWNYQMAGRGTGRPPRAGPGNPLLGERRPDRDAPSAATRRAAAP